MSPTLHAGLNVERRTHDVLRNEPDGQDAVSSDSGALRQKSLNGMVDDTASEVLDLGLLDGASGEHSGPAPGRGLDLNGMLEGGQRPVVGTVEGLGSGAKGVPHSGDAPPALWMVRPMHSELTVPAVGAGQHDPQQQCAMTPQVYQRFMAGAAPTAAAGSSSVHVGVAQDSSARAFGIAGATSMGGSSTGTARGSGEGWLVHEQQGQNLRQQQAQQQAQQHRHQKQQQQTQQHQHQRQHHQQQQQLQQQVLPWACVLCLAAPSPCPAVFEFLMNLSR
jgi:hypothetical protein